MINSTKYKTAAAMVAVLALAACGNPEKSAQSDIQKAHQAWQAEATDFNPTQRLKNYNQIIGDVEKVGKDYPETTYGKAILSNRSIDGVSLSDMKRARDALAPRAACYANPTVECLRPFSSRPNGVRTSGRGGSAGGPLPQAQQLVCSKGFAAADHALDDLKINKPVYGRDLIQVALAAAKCSKPAEVKAAVKAFMATIPAQGDARMNALMSILATDDLQPAWPMIMQELEGDLKAPGVPKNKAAGIAATLTVAYAKSGDTKSALAKYHYVTDTLGYKLDPDSKKELSRQLILHGDADEGLKYIDLPDNLHQQVVALNHAARALGERLKVTQPATGTPISGANGLYMTPVPAQAKGYYETAVDSIEAALDKLAPQVKPAAIDMVGIDLAYGIVALLRQKLGQPEKATAALKKGEAIRTRLLGRSDASPNLRYFSEYQTTLALAQNKPDDAARYAKFTGSPYNYEQWIVTSFARDGEVGNALTYMGGLSSPNGNDYDYIIDTLIQAGKLDQAEQVVRAIPGGASRQAGYYRKFLYKMASDGDQSGAEAYAKKHNLIQSPADQFVLLRRLAESKKIGGDRKQAEPMLRKMFSIAQEIDKNPRHYPGRWNQYTAQAVAGVAFKNGYTDLGIELYRAAAHKNQIPLLAAFSDGMKPQDMGPILMVAQDNLQGIHLRAVIDRAIRHLQKAPEAAS
jgi:hypothetical protein